MSYQDASKPFVPLAPGPRRIVKSQSSMAVSRPKKNSTACLACKAAKRKCSGEPGPCKACIIAGAGDKCHFDRSKDLRRKVGIKRTIDELMYWKILLGSVITKIRLADNKGLNDLAKVLRRSDVPMSEIALAVECPEMKSSDSNASLAAILSLPLSEYMDMDLDVIAQPQPRRDSTGYSKQDKQTSPKASSDPYARVSLESLCDVPFLKVPAKPWTVVTDDNDLVSHLVSLYFIWDHPCVQFLDQSIFLEHMRRGEVDSEFCSPALVNSLLAMASTYSDRPSVFSDPNDKFSRGQKFLEEAERLLRAEEGEPRLVNVQALLFMCHVLSCQGKTNLGWQMLGLAIQMARGLELFAHRNTKKRGSNLSPEMVKVRTITAWSIASLNLQMSTTLQRDGDTTSVWPIYEIEVGGDHDCDWTPYPLLNQITSLTQPARLPQIRIGVARLTENLARIHDLLNGEDFCGDCPNLLSKAKDRYEDLQHWLSAWPDASQTGHEPMPQLLIPRLQCLQAVTNLLKVLIERDSQVFKVQELRQKWRDHLEEMKQCLRLYRTSYGLRYIPSQLVAIVQSGLQALLHQLDEVDEARDVFLELSRLGSGLSQRFKTIADSINKIISLSQRGTANLSPEIIAILDGSESQGQEMGNQGT
ncbi:hypothetical protein N7490_006947 [Penicillium lividum]|nr:hypothetical protein N7490_006947 [Penicillium lividum]